MENGSEFCECEKGYTGNRCDFEECNYGEDEYIFGDEESIKYLNEICPPKFIPMCISCPDLRIKLFKIVSCKVYTFGKVCDIGYDPDFCKNKQDCTQFCKNNICRIKYGDKASISYYFSL